MTSLLSIDFFLALITVQFFSMMAKQTNLYAKQQRADSPHVAVGRGRPWTPTTGVELFNFFGILIITSLVRLPSTPHYFSGVKGVSSVNLPNVSSIMTLKRFQQLKRYLHLADNTKKKPLHHPQHDRLFQVRPLLTVLSKSFRRYYHLGSYVSVDESMIPFKGRSFMKQYIKDKPCKWGFKVWALCCAESGYFFSLCVYTGKGSTEKLHGLATDSVLDVVDAGAVKAGSVVFTDRWFSSPLLMVELLRRGIFTVGTVQTNRTGLPKGLKLPNSTKTNPVHAGEANKFVARVVMKGKPADLFATCWMDKKPVSFCGTAFGLVDDSCDRKDRVTGASNPVCIPVMAKRYQDFMGGVDMGDQTKMQYGVVRNFTTLKPWFKLMVGLIDITLANAWVLYKRCPSTSDKTTHYEFLWAVAEGLFALGRPTQLAQKGSISRVNCDRILEGGHKKNNCVHCLHLKRRRESTYVCRNCRVNLCCAGSCNYDYHAGHYKVHGRSIHKG